MFNFLKKDKGEVININDMDSLIGTVELIDIREPFEYKFGSLKTAKNIPMGNLLNAPNKYLIKDKTYYIMCQSGARSSMAARVLTKQGYNIIDVAGGIGSYVGTNRK
ncbi:MAG: rhodanese-like domain-containing protein [Anaerotignaceae bacterium]